MVSEIVIIFFPAVEIGDCRQTNLNLLMPMIMNKVFHLTVLKFEVMKGIKKS